ncbi:MAG: sigma-70 family RNA polymerase sigma factor [Xanthomonadales bacterium]|jgi:RNA polymerase sigma factor (TIGR02999 family)|nr:sigma-70 family RNA polymerase sigma factor [Xanthomonadales bacterium]
MDTTIEPGTRITDLLHAWSSGEPGAANALAQKVYSQLQSLASARLRLEQRQAFEPAELVNEAWLRLSEVHGVFPSRQHFFAFAALQMRRLLIDAARAHRAYGRVGDTLTVSLRLVDPAPQPADAAVLSEALELLDRLDKRKSQAFALAELAGFDHEQVASILEVSVATIERDLRFARVWLAARIR